MNVELDTLYEWFLQVYEKMSTSSGRDTIRNRFAIYQEMNLKDSEVVTAQHNKFMITNKSKVIKKSLIMYRFLVMF